MTEEEKRDLLRLLMNDLLSNKFTEEEDKVALKIDQLSPDPRWSDYIFWSDDYYDKNDNFLMEKFLNKITQENTKC